MRRCFRSIMVMGLGLWGAVGVRASETGDPARCKAWLDQQVKNLPAFKRKTTTYHWFNCRNVKGYFLSGQMKKLASGYLQERMKNATGMGGTGLYVATDPSSTCRYGRKQSNAPSGTKGISDNACLIAVDVPAGETIGGSKIFPGDFSVMQRFEILKEQGCINMHNIRQEWESERESRRHHWKTNPALVAQTYNLPQSPEGLKTFLSLEHYIQSEGLDESYMASAWGVQIGDEAAITYFKERQRVGAVAYTYGSRALGKVVQDKRALVLKPDIYPRVEYRVYELKDLRDPKTPEARNIHTHLTKSGACPELRLPPLKAPEPTFEQWLEGVGSQYEFSQLLTRRALVETAPAKKHSR